MPWCKMWIKSTQETQDRAVQMTNVGDSGNHLRCRWVKGLCSSVEVMSFKTLSYINYELHLGGRVNIVKVKD